MQFPGWESGLIHIKGGADGGITRNGGYNNFGVKGGDQMISAIKCA